MQTFVTGPRAPIRGGSEIRLMAAVVTVAALFVVLLLLVAAFRAT